MNTCKHESRVPYSVTVDPQDSELLNIVLQCQNCGSRGTNVIDLFYALRDINTVWES